MDLGKLIDEFETLSENITPEQVEKMNTINEEDNTNYQLPEGLTLDLFEESKGKESKLNQLFEDYDGEIEEREVIDWGEDVGKERFWE